MKFGFVSEISTTIEEPRKCRFGGRSDGGRNLLSGKFVITTIAYTPKSLGIYFIKSQLNQIVQK